MIRVLRLRPGHAPEVAQMDDSLDSLQRAVGGHIEIVKVGDRLDLVVNENGAHDLLGSLDGHSITGVALVVRKDDAGELVDVTDDDVAGVVARFVPSKAMN
jgi:hypothetical protein